MNGECIDYKHVKTWEQAKAELPDANLAVISIPGIYATKEADRALDEGLHVFIFSGSVSVEEEVRLKKKAHQKGLLVMGPDCGTEIIQGIPIAIANRVSQGKIGIVGASGTGMQELTTIIDRLGEGVTNAVGTGGRDLSMEVGGITMMDAVNAMELDSQVETVIVISKPPAKEVRNKIISRLSTYKKPVITVFLGEKPETYTKGFYHAYTLDEAARIAVRLVRGEKAVSVDLFHPNVENPFEKEEKKTIKAFYSGATLANEAAMMIRDVLKLRTSLGKREGCLLDCEGHKVVDFGADIFTMGKRNPKIDPEKRIESMAKVADDPSTGVILFDIVMGYGAHDDMANALLPVIRKLKSKAGKESRKLFFVTTVCGSALDPQNYDYQKKLMQEAGVIVCESNKQAVETALFCCGYPYFEKEKEIVEMQEKEKYLPVVSEKVIDFFGKKPKIINIGLNRFSEGLKEVGCEVVQFDWSVPVEYDVELKKTLTVLEKYKFN